MVPPPTCFTFLSVDTGFSSGELVGVVETLPQRPLYIMRFGAAIRLRRGIDFG